MVGLSWNSQSEWFLVQFWPVALNSLPGSAWAGNGMHQGLLPEHTDLTRCPSNLSPLKHFHSHSLPHCESTTVMTCSTALALVKILTQTTLNMPTKPQGATCNQRSGHNCASTSGLVLSSSIDMAKEQHSLLVCS